MANFPPYQYQQPMAFPQQMPMYQPSYQPVQMQPVQQTDQPLFCRLVASREEVLAVPADFSGKPMTFIGPQYQTVWIKVFNPATGSADVLDFHRPGVDAPKEAAVASVNPDEFAKLVEVVRKQGEEIDRLRGMRRRVKEDDSNEV